jgi:hypothetical protein
VDNTLQARVAVKNRPEIVPGIPDMKNKRQPAVYAQLDLPAQGCKLVIFIRIVFKIIQADFADSNNT